MVERTAKKPLKFNPSWILAAILALAGIYFYQDPSWNGNSRLDAVRAIVEQGKYTIDAYQALPGWETGDKISFNGHYYSDKAAGSSVLAIPPYFLMYWLANLLGMTLKSSLVKHILTILIIVSSFLINGMVMYQIALLISRNSRKSFFLALTVSLGTMLWPYSVVYYGHVPAAMFACLAFYWLFSMRNSPEKISWVRFVWAGISLGFAFVTDYTTAGIIAGLLVYALIRLLSQKFPALIKHAVELALGTLPPLSLLFIWDYLSFGNPFTLSYSIYSPGASQELRGIYYFFFRSPSLGILYHLTFDPQFGLFWQSPILLLAFVGYFKAFRTRVYRIEMLFSVYAILSILFLTVANRWWWSGHAFGSRYLIVALPLFIIPLAALPDSLDWLAWLAGAVSAVQMLIPLMGEIQMPIDWIASRNQFWIALKPFEGFSILWNYGLPYIIKTFKNGAPSWTLGYALRFIPYRLYLSLPIFLGAETALIALLFRNTHSISRPMDKYLGAPET